MTSSQIEQNAVNLCKYIMVNFESREKFS